MLRGVTIALLVPVAAGITISGGAEKAVDFLINPDDGLNKVWMSGECQRQLCG